MYTFLAIAIGAVFGAWSRYLMTQLVQAIWGQSFPFATLIINVSGCFAMGFLFVETLERLTLPGAVRTGILTGFLGAYTTFSTYSMETLLLAEQGAAVRSAIYVLASNLIGITAAFVGSYLARNL
ncbi:MAG: fluoride efflux transporter CrcB [Alphaproteobacteria bacterium]|nr:fluoride efflux transporter CrcB [Alphaproteobacteria bacterium]